MADTVILGMPLAQAIGTWGNFINGEAHGGATNVPWGILVVSVKENASFLYETRWDYRLFIVILRFKKNKK